MRIVVGERIRLPRCADGDGARGAGKPSREEVEFYAEKYVTELQRLVDVVDPGGKLNVVM